MENDSREKRINTLITQTVNSFYEGLYHLSRIENAFETSVLVPPSEAEREMVDQLMVLMMKLGPIIEGLLKSIENYTEGPKLPGQCWSIPIALTRMLEVKREDMN